MFWYTKAAEQGDADAQTNLGAMLFLSHGVQQSYIQAAKWLILAKAKAGESADKLLEGVEQEMTPAQISEAQRLAADWWAAHPAGEPTTAITASASPTVRVTSVVLGRAVGPDQKIKVPTTSFSKGDVIYASVSTVGSDPNAKLTARWTLLFLYHSTAGFRNAKLPSNWQHRDGQYFAQSSETIGRNDPGITEFHISTPDG